MNKADLMLSRPERAPAMRRARSARRVPPARGGRAARSGAGFTLPEVLAALAVLGLILGGLTQGIRFGARAMRSQAQSLAAGNDLAQADRALRTLIAGAVPGDGPARFVGGGREMSFRTTLPGEPGLAGPPGLPTRGATTTLGAREAIATLGAREATTTLRAREAIVILRVDGAHKLHMLWSPSLVNWIVPIPASSRAEILDEVDHIEFGYWDPSLNLPPGAWATAWAAASAPRLLRLRIVFTAASSLRWPPIIVAAARDAREP